jgi:hypothetical protein
MRFEEYSSSVAFVFLFSLTRKIKQLEILWEKQFEIHGGIKLRSNVPCIVVGTKSDLSREIDGDDCAFANSMDAPILSFRFFKNTQQDIIRAVGALLILARRLL